MKSSPAKSASRLFKLIYSIAIISALILVLTACGGGGSADPEPEQKLPNQPSPSRRI